MREMEKGMTPGPRLGCGIALWRDERLLLVRRRRAPEAGTWSFPGGKVDPFEPTEAAARRETLEELGIEVGPLELLCVADLIDPEAGQHWVSPVYVAQEWQGEPHLVEPDKHERFDWFALDALPEQISIAVATATAALQRRLQR